MATISSPRVARAGLDDPARDRLVHEDLADCGRSSSGDVGDVDGGLQPRQWVALELFCRRSGSRPPRRDSRAWCGTKNRSSCASGSGKVPSYSIGFWVAITRKGSDERARDPVHGHLLLGHRLEQGGLRLRHRAVDLVHEDDVREHRPRPELEVPLALVEDRQAGDVERLQVRRALHHATERAPSIDRAKSPGQERSSRCQGRPRAGRGHPP